MPLPSCRKRRHSPDASSLSDTQPGTSSSNVKVVVRVRPENEKEAGSRVVTQVMNENVLVFDPKENSESGLGDSRKRHRDIRKRQNRDLTFAFDYVFGPRSKTSDIYEQTTKSILTGLLNGYNCSVFAYGATGAGKTHTMLGSQESPGVIYLTMLDLYNRIDAMKDTKTCDVAVSYLEVYNETIRDLLIPSGCLPIREDPASGVVIPGLSLHKPKTAEELLYMLQVGNQHRTQHPTDANAESSRSHAVFQVFIRQKDRTANISTEVRIAKLCLVDLAGSERATVTKNRGSRFREGANINRSLLALGNVINALAENKTKGFIPYRDSKLTRLLKDSLGGNCQTVMIAAVSPSTLSFEDTYNTLRYADRAKNIKSTLKKNVLNVDFHIAKYGQIVEELRKEIVELKQKLQESEGRPHTDVAVTQQPVTQDYSESYEVIQNGFAPVMTSHCEQINNEVSLRELQWKMYRKERCLSRLAVLDEPGNNETVDKLKGLVSSMRQKSEFLATKVDVGLDKLAEDGGCLGSLKQRLISSLGSCDGNLPQPLSQCFQVNMLKTELQDTSKHVDYLKRSIRFQQRELQHNERLVHRLLKLIKRQHYIIKGHNIMTSDLHNDYVEIQQIASGQELQWEDQSGDSTFRPGYRLVDMLELPALSRKLTVSGASSSVCIPACSVQELNSASISHTATILSRSEASAASLSEPISQKLQSEMLTEDAECSPAKTRRLDISATNTAPPCRVASSGNDFPSVDNIKRNRLTAVTDINKKPSPGKAGALLDLSQIKVDEVDEKSPDEVFVPKSKFTNINDTIMKCKKYVKLHTADSEKTECLASNTELNGTFTLDSTFTMDPSTSQVPLSAVPNVDSVTSTHKNTSYCDKVNILSGQICQCAKLQTETSNRNPETNKSSIGVSDINKNSICGKCSCVVKPHSDILGSQLNTSDPNDDSATSTLVNSQATVSTLNDSQNLSGISQYMDIAYNRNHRNGILSSQSVNLSETFTLGSVLHDDTLVSSETLVNYETLVSSETLGSKTTKAHAARSIKFEDGDSARRGSGGKMPLSVRKTPDRKPLQPMGTSNTSPDAKSVRVPALSRSQSMVVKSLMGNKGSYSFKTKSYTPNYMKTTKAAARRFEHNSQTTDITEPSATSSNMAQLKKFKSAFFGRKPRPLVPSMRSKSTSNLSSRAAWQL